MSYEEKETNRNLQTLICQWGNLKSRLTKLKIQIESLENNVNINLLTLKQNRLSNISEEFEEIQNKIDLSISTWSL